VFLKKTTKLNYQPAQYEKNKIAKTILEKKNKKNHKTIMWGNTIAIHSVFFKKTTKLNSQSASY
jgi:hypothetical protein